MRKKLTEAVINAVTEPVLSATNVSKNVLLSHARSLSILRGIHLEIKAGESVAIVGTSGSGKTTLLSLLAGLDSASSGEVHLLGHPLSRLDESAKAILRRKYVGFVFQNFQLIGSLTALENIVLPLELKGMPNAIEHARELLSRVGVLEREQHYPSQLSGGEQQRVALARAFAGKPAILFADEPTGNLDAATSQRVADIMFELNADTGTTLVLVTHDETLASRCRRSLRLNAGSLV